MTLQHVIFDIGGVLVNWQPHLAWMDHFETREAAEAFMERTAFPERNLRADGGARFEDLAAELADPADRAQFARYVSRYAETIPEAIEGSWALMDRLKANGLHIHAITNWSAETWPVGLTKHPRLGTSFETLVVSGEEGLLKPDVAIFDLLRARAGGIAAEACVFIDDSETNVAGAKTAGMDAIHFTSPEALETALTQRGLL